MTTYNVLVNSQGTEYWYKDDKLHRENGPAVIFSSGTKEWYKNGKLHRDNGPAVVFYDGTQKWYKNGKMHREDEPAIVFVNGDKGIYCLEGVRITNITNDKEEFEKFKTTIDYIKTCDNLNLILKVLENNCKKEN